VTGYLLDTNIVSDLIRNPQGRIAVQIGKVGEANICTSHSGWPAGQNAQAEMDVWR
jgi:hypothetical protein